MKIGAINMVGVVLIGIASAVIFGETVAPLLALYAGVSILQAAGLWLVAGIAIIIGNKLS